MVKPKGKPKAFLLRENSYQRFGRTSFGRQRENLPFPFGEGRENVKPKVRNF